MATSLGRSGEIWSSYSASISKWGPKIPFKEGPGSFAAPMHPRRAQEWAEWGQVGPAAACLHAGSCVRNVSCCPGRGMLTASSSCTENIQVWAENLPCMKKSTCCGSKAHYVAAEAGNVILSFTWNLKMLVTDELYWQMSMNHVGNTSDRGKSYQ